MGRARATAGDKEAHDSREKEEGQGESEGWTQQSSMLRVPIRAPSNTDSEMRTWGASLLGR